MLLLVRASAGIPEGDFSGGVCWARLFAIASFNVACRWPGPYRCFGSLPPVEGWCRAGSMAADVWLLARVFRLGGPPTASEALRLELLVVAFVVLVAAAGVRGTVSSSSSSSILCWVGGLLAPPFFLSSRHLRAARACIQRVFQLGRKVANTRTRMQMHICHVQFCAIQKRPLDPSWPDFVPCEHSE